VLKTAVPARAAAFSLFVAAFHRAGAKADFRHSDTVRTRPYDIAAAFMQLWGA
jgi:hypothetical protein